MDNSSAAPASGAVSSSARPNGWGAEFRALIALGWPLVVAQLASIALFTTDTIMLGWLGPKYLAAASLANALFIAAMLFGQGITGAVTPVVAQSLGAKDTRSVRRTVRQGIWIALIVGIVLFPIVWNIAPIYRALGENAELTAMAESFIHVVIWSSFPSFFAVVFRSFLAAHGATRVILWITVAGFFVNALGDYALIFGNWGFPRLELVGAGISTTTVNVVTLVVMVAYTLTHRRFRRYHIFHNFFRADWPRFFELWRIGLPIGLMALAEVAMFTGASLLQGWISEDSVAAHAIGLTLSSISFMVPLGLSQAATVRVGKALGERNREGIRKAGWTALAVTLIFMSATAVLFLSFPRALVGLFLDAGNPANAGAIALATTFMTVAGFFQLFDGTQVTMGATLRGLSDTKMPLVIALVGYWLIGIPIAYTLAFPLGLHGLGIRIGLASGLAAVALTLTVRFALRERLDLTSKTPI